MNRWYYEWKYFPRSEIENPKSSDSEACIYFCLKACFEKFMNLRRIFSQRDLLPENLTLIFDSHFWLNSRVKLPLYFILNQSNNLVIILSDNHYISSENHNFFGHFWLKSGILWSFLTEIWNYLVVFDWILEYDYNYNSS